MRIDGLNAVHDNEGFYDTSRVGCIAGEAFSTGPNAGKWSVSPSSAIVPAEYQLT
jgi:hypothetical protein